ncbi:FN3 associated domain-containing protein [Anaerotignum sp.]|uniref:FN3 associated domain-containing protein n=1 Tax=Anaerotignum sp. TaxID=2039241 RepID=UPI0028A13DF9|nr:FN3 associated domain-containing protein [Anaerotignum sp.]
MKYKKYLTMFLAGTLVVSSSPTKIFAESNEQQVEQQDTGETKADKTVVGETVATDTEEADTGETHTEEAGTEEEDTGEADTGEPDTKEADTGEADTEEDAGDLGSGEPETGKTETEEIGSTENEETENEEAEITKGMENTEESENINEVEEVLTQETNLIESSFLEVSSVTVEGPIITTHDSDDISQTYYANNTTVSVEMAVPENTQVYYTIDGTDPIESETKKLFSETFTVTATSTEAETVTIKAVATQEGIEGEDGTTQYSELVTKEIGFIAAVEVSEPVIKTYDSSGDYQENYSYLSPVTVEINAPFNTEVFFTTDGSDPTQSNTKQLYEGSFTVSLPMAQYMTGGTTEIKAVVRTGVECGNGDMVYVYSNLASGSIVFRAATSLKNPTIKATQKISGASTTTSSLQKSISNIPNNETVVIEITHTNDPSSKILYTLDGTDPRESETALAYTDEFSITANSLAAESVVIRVTVEVMDGTQKTYTSPRKLTLNFLQEDIAAPEISLTTLEDGESKYRNAAEVTANITNYDVQLGYVYTLNGTDPTLESSVYDNSTGIVGIKAPSQAGGKVTIKVAAVKNGKYLSDITTKEIYFKSADTFELTQGDYIADFAIVCNDEDNAWLKDYIDAKDVELNVDNEGKVNLTIRFVEKTTDKLAVESYKFKSAKLVNHEGDETDLIFEEPSEIKSYAYSSNSTYVIKTVTVPMEFLSADVSVQFQNSNGVWINFVFTLNSQPKPTSEKTIDNSALNYSIKADSKAFCYDGYRQSKFPIKIQFKNRGYSATRPMVYYFSTDDAEAISFDSRSTNLPVVDSLAVATNYQGADEDAYEIFTKSNDPHTLNVRVKGYVEGLGWTDEISIPLEFNKRALPSEIEDANGSNIKLTTTGTFYDGKSDLGYTIPYDTVFKVDTEEDKTKLGIYSNLISQVNSDHGSSKKKVLNITLATPSGEQVKVLDAFGEFKESFLSIPQTESFLVEAVSVYHINKAGTEAILLPRYAGSNEMGYGMYKITNEYPDGVYVLVAGENADMPALASGYYYATARLKDSNNKFENNEYEDMIDSKYQQGYAMLDIRTYSKYLYLPLAHKNGEYVKEFYYYDYTKNAYKKAAVEETYTVNGEKYVKLAKIPITTKKAYLNVYFTTSAGKTQYGIMEMDYSSVSSAAGIPTQGPKMTTETGAMSYVNDGKALVSLATASENAKIYYTCTSGKTGIDPDTTKASQIFRNPFELSTENKEGEIFTIRAVTVKNGFITSDIMEFKISFNKEGMAAVTAEKPIIFAKYNSGDVAANGIYTVKIANATEGTTVYYTTDGSQPSEQNGTLYTESFEVPAITNDNPTVIRAIAIGANINASEIAQKTIAFSSNWWDNMEPGYSYEVQIKMLNFANNSLLSMGNGALTGKAILSVDTEGNHFLTVPFQGINMGAGLGYLIDMWYFENEDATGEDIWKDTKIQGEYTYSVSGKITTVTIPLFNDHAKVSVGIESDFQAMGKQRATLSMDYSKVIEAVTGDVVVVEKQVDSPIIDGVLNAKGDAMTITISLPSASEVQDADIYYFVSRKDDIDVDKIVKNKYSGAFTISKSEAAAFGGIDGTVNVLAVAVKNGYMDSLVNVKKLTFNTSAIDPTKPIEGAVDVTKDGKYWVYISLYKANDNELSMGNVAFENNSKALIVTSGGKSVIQMGSNPVKIPPYYSALQEFQFKNAGGTYQLATELETKEIKTTYNGVDYTFDYLKKFEFTLPSVTENYIDVKVKVPYTIMDSAVGDSAIPARLKIDWSGITVAKDSDELRTSDSVAESSIAIQSSPIDKTDPKTGIRLVALADILMEGTTLATAEIKTGAQFKLVQKAIGDEFTKFTAFSILAMLDDKETTPLGNVKIYIPIPEGLDEQRVALYRINEDGTKTLVHGVVNHGGLIPAASGMKPNYFEFETDKLGLFVLVETEEILNIPVIAEEIEEKELFDDISGHWAKEYIIKAVGMGLFHGMSDISFEPNVKMTRGMFVTVLGKIEGITSKTYRGDKFSDVKDGDYYSSYVLWASDMGIAKGINDNNFAPNAPITREQVAAMLAKYAQLKGIDLQSSGNHEFVDAAAVSDWAKDGVEMLAKAGVLSGRENRTFSPKDAASRAEVAVMLVRFLEQYMPSRGALETEKI